MKFLKYAFITIFSFLGCSSATVKESTDRTATITASDDGDDKAKQSAYAKAREIFGAEPRESKESVCDKTWISGAGFGKTKYHYDCTFYFEKVDGTEPDSLPSLAMSDDREKWPAINEQIKRKIADGTNVNAKNGLGGTALSYAIQFGNTELVKILIAAKADLSSANHPIFNANNIILTELLKAGLNPNLADNDGQTLIYRSSDCQGGKVNTLKYIQPLVAFKAKPNIAEPSYGRTPLHEAIRSGCDPTIIQALLDAGANPNAKLSREETAFLMAGSTPLFLVPTGYNKNPDAGKSVIDILLKKGAKINAADSDGCTTLSQAANYYSSALVSYLKQKGAKQSKCDAENDEARSRHDRQQIASDDKNREFCAQWADMMPPAARPRNYSDIERACSNAWARGTGDYQKCVQTWKGCKNLY